MRTLYFDCFSGASGDMLLGALVDLGADAAAIERALAGLGLGEIRLRISRVTRSELAATKVDVVVDGFVEGEGGRALRADAGHGHDHAHEHGHHHSHAHDGDHAREHAPAGEHDPDHEADVREHGPAHEGAGKGDERRERKRDRKHGSKSEAAFARSRERRPEDDYAHGEPHGHEHEQHGQGPDHAHGGHDHTHSHGSHDHAHGHSHDRANDVHAHGHVHARHGHGGGGTGRGLAEILALIESSGLSPVTKDRASRAFQRLGEAEAKMHGTTPERVHFHEVGAADAIADVVGSCVAFEMLGVERFLCSPINVGGGTVKFSHGTYPVPAPATLELLRGAPIYGGAVRKELVTPTGAAIVTTLADAYSAVPEMRLDRVGYGAGGRDVPRHPNVLRLMLGETAARAEEAAPDRVVVLEAAIDDMPAEALAYFAERALAEGALDAYFAPVTMKKGRPGAALTVIAEVADLDRMAALVFRETTTIGLRHRVAERRVLDRERVTVMTPVGPIRVKVARMDGAVVNAAPEFEDCREAALRSSLPLREVQALAAAAFREGALG